MRCSDKSLGILKIQNTELEAELSTRVSKTAEVDKIQDERMQGLRDQIDALTTINAGLEDDSRDVLKRMAALAASNEALNASVESLRAEAATAEATAEAVTSGLRSMLEQSDSSREQVANNFPTMLVPHGSVDRLRGESHPLNPPPLHPQTPLK